MTYLAAQDDNYDREYYQGQFNRSMFLYQSTRPWRVLHRTVLMARTRKAAADLVALGGRPSMPLSTRERFYAAFKRTWDGWLGDVVVVVAIVLAAASVVVGVIFGMVKLSDNGPDVLPKGIHQNGYSFIVPANYAAGSDYDKAHASSLCTRLPIWDNNRTNGHNDWFTAHGDPNGSITITCVLNPKRDD